jgi:ATP-dependent DNA helicase RecQ
MKDQVDGLKDMGIAAACLNSSQTPAMQREVLSRIKQGDIKILYLSPERLQTQETLALLKSKLSFFVIDEAHCISHWGHDFRDEYRNLGSIRSNFSGIKVHGFTATATREVQADILSQLNLSNPFINIASVDRPNLVYRVMLRTNILSQVMETLKKHSGEAGIIYCLRRKDVDDLSNKLNGLGFKNCPYHAGLSDGDRHAAQEQFMGEDLNIIVATVAFGMGIDRSNIRFVIHAAMPRSIEHYHQETGRAGRDGLPSYCYMFYGGGDYGTWDYLTKESSNREILMRKLGVMYNFCAQPQCRHKVFVGYFGQKYESASCQACDYCLGEVDMIENPVEVGQKILRCIESIQTRPGQSFGAGYVADVLKGNSTEQVLKWGHQNNPNFGTMPSESLQFIRYLIEQLAGQGMLERKGEYNTLFITDLGKQFLKDEIKPILAKLLVAKKKKEISAIQKAKKEKDWEDADVALFELLREKRAALAREQGVPAYVVFGDKSLKDMATVKPVTRDAFSVIFGVGEHKLKTYANSFLDVIRQYFEKNTANANSKKG